MTFRVVTLLFLLFVSMMRVEATPPPVPSVAVQGILQIGEFLGPPSYGENPGSDRLEPSYFLQLPAPLITQVHPAGALSGFSQQSQTTFFVQLVVFDEEQSVAKALIG